MKHWKKLFVDPEGQVHEISEFINYSTNYVVYARTCPCNKIYVGRMIRLLREYFCEHRLSVEKGAPQFAVSRHFLEKHNKDSSLLKVFGIQHIGPRLQEGNRFKVLSNQETFWTFKLGSLPP